MTGQRQSACSCIHVHVAAFVARLLPFVRTQLRTRLCPASSSSRVLCCCRRRRHCRCCCCCCCTSTLPSTDRLTPHKPGIRCDARSEAAGGASAPLIRAETACRSFLPPHDPGPRQPTSQASHRICSQHHTLCARPRLPPFAFPCCRAQACLGTMPIFHEPDDPPPTSLPRVERTWKPGNGCEQTHLRCKSPTASSPSIASPQFDDTALPAHVRNSPHLDRIDLIERLKRVNSPPWQHPTPERSQYGGYDATNKSRPTSRDRPKTPLLSPTRYKTPRPRSPDPLQSNASAGLEIQRPRSALHSGDFSSEDKEHRGRQYQESSSTIPLATSPVVPWHRSFPAAARPPSHASSLSSLDQASSCHQPSLARVRAISQSSISSFAFLPPTSPLVQQSNNTDLDFSSRSSSRQPSRSPERSTRRHTFSPQSARTFDPCGTAALVSGTPAARHIRKPAAMPYQAHQPRRSLTSLNQLLPHSSPQTPLIGSRRPSLSSEASPLHHAPMVGSYEESILRGRMSTTPSRPLNFIAKIGVLGRGQCKSNLKCPPHIAVPFPAVFYSYSTGNGRISDDSPSPYVGLVDLENSIVPSEEPPESSRRKRQHPFPDPEWDHLDVRLDQREGPDGKLKKDRRRQEKRKRRSASPKAPPGGSYRIPQQGQLQIVIKNPNKTAVKLFLVPYDLSDMQPGQKTFIRQRSYSAGPIIDMPLSSRKNLGTDRPEASLSHSDDPNERPILRYLIHLHMCCPSKGRFYLYKSIRVVFANRVPDGKEKLRNEIQMPEPRYSAYKPSRDSLASQLPSYTATQLTSEKAWRRASAGQSLSQHYHSREENASKRNYPQLPPPAIRFTGGPSPDAVLSSSVPAVDPIPFTLMRIPSIPSRPVSRECMDIDSVDPFISQSRSTSPTASGISNTRSSVSDTTAFGKLNKGDIGYGGNVFCPTDGSSLSPGAGLLARGLRGLDVEPDDDFVS